MRVRSRSKSLHRRAVKYSFAGMPVRSMAASVIRFAWT